MSIRPRRKFWSSYNIPYLGVAAVLISLIPIALEPMINSKKYKDIQKETRKNINQEEVQPGNMRVWSDPFGKKNDRDEDN
ncbi:small integral membrane protein 20-like [Sitodiplosis mosellana]|uniref:small integral membrane protein 20-like n=1 Tax=Sitodiplosis mosellana TaxID=263140 RepID=UPI002444266A|nr:small integral membrane protein 20-like [Sitodiplosis mosellana]